MEKYRMPDGSLVFIAGLPNVVKDPITGKEWNADLEASKRDAKKIRRIGVLERDHNA